MKKIVAILLMGIVILSACIAPAAPSTTVAPTKAAPTQIPATPTLIPEPHQYPWWNDSTFYEIFVRSFYDSNGDGIGDFNGITQKLDYLKQLGITGIWLMPIFPSPSYHGYDVTDYYSVNPQYGTLADFKNLLAAAHQRGIRVILDLVLNHTSDKHPWFQSAVNDKKSPYRDWYIWSDTKPNYVGPWGEVVWHPSPTGYYYGIFESFMPDLNYTNPAVTQEMQKIVSFWLKDIGVDGFRLDAAKHLIEQGDLQENTSATHDWYKQFRPIYKGINPQALTVGEISGGDQIVMASYSKGDQLDMTFDFGQAAALVQAARDGNALDFKGSAALTYKLVPNLQYATFITNHDQNRVMSELNGDVNKAKSAAFLLLTSPGVPFIYYGEEIGMQGTKPDEDIRRPMQWDSSNNAGFTTGMPWESLDTNIQQVNVQTETSDANSLLSFYRSLIALRNQHIALRTGSMILVRAGDSALYASLRVDVRESILLLANLSDHPITATDLSLLQGTIQPGSYSLTPLLGTGKFPVLKTDANGKFSGFKPLNEIPAYGVYALQITLIK